MPSLPSAEKPAEHETVRRSVQLRCLSDMRRQSQETTPEQALSNMSDGIAGARDTGDIVSSLCLPPMRQLRKGSTPEAVGMSCQSLAPVVLRVHDPSTEQILYRVWPAAAVPHQGRHVVRHLRLPTMQDMREAAAK